MFVLLQVTVFVIAAIILNACSSFLELALITNFLSRLRCLFTGGKSVESFRNYKKITQKSHKNHTKINKACDLCVIFCSITKK